MKRQEITKTIYYARVDFSRARLIEIQAIEKPSTYWVKSEKPLFGGGRFFLSRIKKDDEHVFEKAELATMYLIGYLTECIDRTKTTLDSLIEQHKKLVAVIDAVEKERGEG